MEVLRRRKKEDKSEHEKEQELEKEKKLKHGESSDTTDTSPSKVQKDNSLEQLLHQQKQDWERQKLEAEKEAKKERPTLHNIELPNLKSAAFKAWQAFHDLSYPPEDEIVEDLEASGVPRYIQEQFKIGYIENLKEAGARLTQKLKPEEIKAAGLDLLKPYVEKDVPVLVFPYLRDDEICFISCRALLSREERKELGVSRYIRLGEKIPFPYNSNAFDHILSREKKKVFFLYPSRYRLNILSKEEDVLIVAEKGFDAIAVRDFHLEEEWLKLFVQVEPVLIVDMHDRKYPEWEKKAEILKEQFKRHDMLMRLEVLPQDVDVPGWFVKSNLGERKFKVEKPKELEDKPKRDQ